MIHFKPGFCVRNSNAEFGIMAYNHEIKIVFLTLSKYN
jgi:hypothetical protein